MQAQTEQSTDAFEIGAVVRRSSEAVANCMRADGVEPDRMRVTQLSRTRDSVVLKYDGGAKALVVKAFNPGNPDAHTYLEREAMVAKALRGRGLAPRYCGHSDRGLFVVTDFIDGVTLDEMLSEDTLLHVSERLGSWARMFAQSLPATEMQMDWATYLSRYDEALFRPEELHRVWDLLTGLQIRHKALAKNDAALRNYVRNPEGRLLGLDFESVTLKPLGWDLLVTGRVLAQRFPGRIDEIAQALVAGWRGPVDGNPPEAFARLVQFFASVTARRRPKAGGGQLAQVQARYNAHAARDGALPQVSHTFAIPITDDGLEAPSQAQLAALREALQREADAAVADPPEPASETARVNVHPPSRAMASACTICKGGCCRQGLGEHAFVKAPTMRRLLALAPGTTAEQLVERYMAYLPAQHVAGSCLYHDQTGCNIPREARSSICNRYLCRSGRLIEASEPAVRDGDAPVLFVAMEEGRATRAGLFAGGACQRVDAAVQAPDAAGPE